MQIGPAIAAAASGDTILVRPGTYLSFQVQTKGLAILADPGVTLTIPSGGTGIAVSSTTASQPVVLRGFTLQPSIGGPTLTARNCLGHLAIEDCVLYAANGSYSGATAR